MNNFFATGFVLGMVGSWMTSFIYAIKHSEWVLLLVDCVFFPAGIVHGMGLWFGWW